MKRLRDTGFIFLLLLESFGFQQGFCQRMDPAKREMSERSWEERVRIWKQWADLSEEDLFAAYLEEWDPWLRSHVPGILPLRVEDGKIRLSSPFGRRIHPLTLESHFHSGIDLAAAEGQWVYATAQGLVERTGRDPFLGNFILLSHAGMFQTCYGHLSQIHVMAGQRVNRGDIIGMVGNSGRSTSPHLHYSVKRFGKFVDADRYLFLRFGLIN